MFIEFASISTNLNRIFFPLGVYTRFGAPDNSVNDESNKF